MTDDRPGDEQWVVDPRFELNELRRPQFLTLRKGGLDPAEVEAYIGRLERLAKNFVTFTRELEARISHAKSEARDARQAERRAVDEAMLAAFEAKERLLLQAEEQAWEIEEEARRRAAAIKESIGVTEAPDEELVELRERLAVFQQKIEDLEIQVDQWQKRASRLESDAQRHAELASDVSEQRRRAESTAEHAGEVLEAAERRSQALMAAARAEAARIAADAEEEAERLRDRLGVLEEAAETGPPIELDEVRREVDEIRAAAEADAARIYAAAEVEKTRLLDEARTEADGVVEDARRRTADHNEHLVGEISDRLADAERQHQEIVSTAQGEADRLVAAAEASAAETVTAGQARVAELLARTKEEADAEAKQLLGEAQAAADETRRDAEELLEAARAAHRRMEKKSASLLASAEKTKAAAAEAEVEAAQLRRDAETEAARLVAEASAVLERARQEGRPSQPAAPSGEPSTPDVEEPPQNQAIEAPGSSEPDRRRSRYARQSAQLPHIGEDAGEVLSAMTDLRRRLQDHDETGDR